MPLHSFMAQLANVWTILRSCFCIDFFNLAFGMSVFFWSTSIANTFCIFVFSAMKSCHGLLTFWHLNRFWSSNFSRICSPMWGNLKNASSIWPFILLSFFPFCRLWHDFQLLPYWFQLVQQRSSWFLLGFAIASTTMGFAS